MNIWYNSIDSFETWWFALKDNLFELGWRFFAGIGKWYHYRGWHRFCVVFGIGLFVYAFIITFVHWGRRKK